MNDFRTDFEVKSLGLDRPELANLDCKTIIH